MDQGNVGATGWSPLSWKKGCLAHCNGVAAFAAERQLAVNMRKEMVTCISRLMPIGIVKQFAEDQEMETRNSASRLGRLIIALGIPSELKMISFVNGTKADLDRELHDGDEIKLVTLATGG